MMPPLLLILLLLSAATTGSAAPASAPTGQFIVVAAPRHPTVSNMQAAYRPDDPRLINRIIEFDGTAANYDAGTIDCARTTRTTTQIKAGQLIRRIFPDRPNYGKIYVTKLADFGLKLAPTDIVPVTRFRCVQPRHDGKRWTDATMFPLGDGRWALWLVREHMLILKPATGPIRASFDCAKAASVAERTICSNRVIAGWDRSVSAAYKDDGTVEEQRVWLAERDKCGTDQDCLHLSMKTRVLNLLH